ncbi:3-isopropylmalate dehydratase large subunit [Bordetella hinzii]|uniref:3-isopropylmalate dehydratase n=1 Tax=Bordetella hinzii OH87 BAL007II TaxID=1331262 RepID=A0ABR4R4A2_9BORD|nr:3-isopropylmalate dehydratase large subunit [Bordetella hinzii]KCB25309.1 3-isopropylmalate dehydratase large subunit [Bordetella hinzii OH87 BAL007II]KCB44445.1 3-isopropylmalate dehydratase large subunit [Bordetella hinzii 5132]QDJ43236.1 3-isopropylmalate dehydratase [Bordetella hinzii]QDJ47809.1 3-isopropylmalate dehydratase [Bordetella hinzii]QWF38691.1 3-isopropylmalate dehydratase large subunit [Bordetella hinzii]
MTPTIARRPRTLFDKFWASHHVAELEDGRSLVHIDRHLLHDLSSPQAFDALRAAGRRVHSPGRNIAIADHIVSTAPGRQAERVPGGDAMLDALAANAAEFGLRHYGPDHPDQGIVHVLAPELGLVLPGMTVACGDSHTSTLGALGAWAWGIGTSEAEHVLATQTLAMRRPAAMRLTLTGALPPALSAKDMALHVLRRIGVRGAPVGFLELAGPAIAALPMEGRLTVCNMAIEAGARAAVIAPDAVTLQYLRQHAPEVCADPRAVADFQHWRSDARARYDTELALELALSEPQLTWGTDPSQVAGVGEALPDPEQADDKAGRDALLRAYRYMDLAPGRPLAGTPVQWVFIGSCTNGRLSDLRAAASIAQGGRVAAGVRALVVPGSRRVKRAAEALGLDRIFIEAGFEWREPGCSMCVGMNADKVPAGQRCVTTSNRNFEGRQGPGARSHLASPASAAAAALAGHIVDHRELV